MNAPRRQKDLFCMPFPACDAGALAAQIGGSANAATSLLLAQIAPTAIPKLA